LRRPEKFFPLADATFKSQRELFEKAQAATPEQQAQLQANPSPQLFAEIAGVQQWAAQRGVPSARSNACLTNQNLQNKLMQTSSDVATQYPGLRRNADVHPQRQDAGGPDVGQARAGDPRRARQLAPMRVGATI